MNINLSFFPDFLDFFYDKCKKTKTMYRRSKKQINWVWGPKYGKNLFTLIIGHVLIDYNSATVKLLSMITICEHESIRTCTGWLAQGYKVHTGIATLTHSENRRNDELFTFEICSMNASILPWKIIFNIEQVKHYISRHTMGTER